MQTHKNTPPPSEKSKQQKMNTANIPLIALRIIAWLFFLMVAGVITIAAVGAIAYASAYNKIPDVQSLAQYEPKLPLRIFTEDGVLIGEYSEERREFTPIDQIPKSLQNALLAVEDANFANHIGVDFRGLARATVAELMGSDRRQGGSTITMQVARNFYLTKEKTYTRKFYEILTAIRIENTLSKKQILEIYMNQMFLGHRSYGFAAAAHTYFGKNLDQLTTAEEAMLVGLPQAPSNSNPFTNPQAANERQKHVLNRMRFVGAITEAQYQTALAEPLQLKKPTIRELHAEYASDEAQQIILEHFKEGAYTSGLSVYTTIKSAYQKPAYQALRNGLINFEKNKFYRGPEMLQGSITPQTPHGTPDIVKISGSADELIKAVKDAIERHPDNEELMTAVVLSVEPKKVVLTRNGVDKITITGKGLTPVESGLSSKAANHIKIQVGSIVRIHQRDADNWDITQIPEVDGSVISLNPQTGAILAMVGGFDFADNKFNRSTQAWRQPGSSFKPFVYSAALERGITPNTIINDAPIVVRNPGNNKPWTPKNFGSGFAGRKPMYESFARSRNIPAVLTIDAISPVFAQEWIHRFGFTPDKHPANLSMILGAGDVTPLQITAAYGVFANGGYQIDPYLISRIVDSKGVTIFEYKAPELTEERRVIPERNAFVISSLLNLSASTPRNSLKRSDIYGKTGTTNDSRDTWFIGYSPAIVTSVYVGYDQPKSLGNNETGHRTALPIWVEYMRSAMKDIPVQPVKRARGVSNIAGQWVYDEFSGSGGVQALGEHLTSNDGASGPTPPSGNPFADSGNPFAGF